MTRREQVIVILMVAAILYGAYALFTQKAEKADLPDQNTALQEANVTVMAAAAALAAPSEDKARRYIIAQADESWPLDPFFKYSPIKEKPKTSEAEQAVAQLLETEVDIVYTGYITAGNRILAIINGVEYEAGEKLPESGLTIVSITRKDVVIGKEGSSVRKVIPLEETEF